MVDALCKCGKIDEAYGLFMEMADQGMNRDAVTISILVTHLTKHAKFQEAESIVHGCFRDEVRLDTVVYNTFIKLMLESGKLHSAVSIYDRMISSGISPSMQISFNSMINAYASSGLHREARAVFQEMQDNDLVPDSFSYLALIRAYTEGKRYKEAEEAIQTMLKSNITPSCPHFSHLIFAFLKEGRISEAQRIYHEMKETGVAPDLACCRTMMRVYMEHGLVAEGISLFETTRGSLKPDSFILSAAFYLYEHERREAEAGEVLDAIRLHGATFLRNLKVGWKIKAD